MSIKSTTLATSATTIYISNSGSSTTTTVYFCNTGISTATFNVYAVPNGQTADTTNIIYNTVQLTPTDTYVLDTERLILDSGDTLQALSSIGGVVVATVSYIGL